MREMPFSDYCSAPGTNWSKLKHMMRSPLAYYEAMTNPVETDTPAMAFGRAAHCAVLEPDEFPLRYVVWDGGIRRGKAWDAFSEANANKEIITASDYERCLKLRDAVRRHPAAGSLLDSGVAERVITWIDPQTGITCKARPDWVSDALADLKTTTDIDGKTFGAHAARLAYHGQMAFYHRGLVANGYPESTPVRIIAAEPVPPFDVAVFELDDNVLWAGEVLVDGLLERLAECIATHNWPGRYQQTQRFELPSWAWPVTNESGSLKVAEREW